MNNTKVIEKAYNFQYRYDLDRKKELAAVYTPETVVQFIVNTTIDSYLNNNPIDLKNIKIIDPACGSGIFLLYAIDYLLRKAEDKNTLTTFPRHIFSTRSLTFLPSAVSNSGVSMPTSRMR